MLDPVDLALFSAPTLSAWTHIDSTGYEDTDAIRIWAECSGGAAVDVVTGVLDDAAHPVGASGSSVTENEWIPHIAALPSDCGTVTVKFGCQMNSNSEECWFDMIEIVEAGGVRVTSRIHFVLVLCAHHKLIVWPSAPHRRGPMRGCHLSERWCVQRCRRMRLR